MQVTVSHRHQETVNSRSGSDQRTGNVLEGFLQPGNVHAQTGAELAVLTDGTMVL